MTKNVKLTQNYIDNVYKPALAKGIFRENDKHFIHIVPPTLISDQEFYKKSEVIADPDNVPIYDSTECTNIIRTQAIEYYGCNCGEVINMRNEVVDTLARIVEEVI